MRVRLGARLTPEGAARVASSLGRGGASTSGGAAGAAGRGPDYVVVVPRAAQQPGGSDAAVCTVEVLLARHAQPAAVLRGFLAGLRAAIALRADPPDAAASKKLGRGGGSLRPPPQAVADAAVAAWEGAGEADRFLAALSAAGWDVSRGNLSPGEWRFDVHAGSLD